jgi:mono/diheme cytochrome c family protein
MRNPSTCLRALVFPVLIASTAPVFAQDAAVAPSGSELYTTNCVSCHQADGKGLPSLAPALKGNAMVAGDPALLIQILLKGPAAVLPEERPKFGSSTMDSFYYKMTDAEMAAVLTYIRQNFGGKDAKAAAVEEKTVAAARAAQDAESQ